MKKSPGALSTSISVVGTALISAAGTVVGHPETPVAFLGHQEVRASRDLGSEPLAGRCMLRMVGVWTDAKKEKAQWNLEGAQEEACGGNGTG